MCGIAGYIKRPGSKVDLDLNKIVQSLFVSIESRGKDASGYAARDPGGALWIVKGPARASEFVKAAPIFKDWYDPNEIIIHTRFETQGSRLDNDNNHPVCDKDTGIAVVHNGWLLNEDYVVKRMKLDKKADVDTETMVNLIARSLQRKPNRVEKAINKSMKYLIGNFACAMLKSKSPGDLWLWRRRNPLVLAMDEKKEIVFFASELVNLVDALAFTKRRFKTWKLREDKLFRVSAGEDRFRGMLFALPEENEKWWPQEERWASGYNWGNWDKDDYYTEKNANEETRQCVVCGDSFLAYSNTDYLSCLPCDHAGFCVKRSDYGEQTFPFDPKTYTATKPKRPSHNKTI